MKKITFGTPEKLTPVKFCKNFNYTETEVNYPVDYIVFKENSRGCTLRLPMDPDEHIFGMGLQLKAFDLQARKLTLRPNADPRTNAGDSHAPVPFFISTKGYGIFVDTARHAEFYFGSSALLSVIDTASNTKVMTSEAELYETRISNTPNISIQIPVAKGVDIYIIEGKNITDIVAQYNMMSGGGCDVPDWGMSAVYRIYAKYTQDEIVDICRDMLDWDITIGTIGLEPGWQTAAYSCTYEWSPERYPEPERFLKEMTDMGYHINLWQHAFIRMNSPLYNPMLPYAGDYTVWEGLVPDFSLPEARTTFAKYHNQFVKMGVDGFKLDECDSSDYTGSWSFPLLAEFPSGLDGEQYHSLFGVLYMQTILEALDGTKTLSQVRNAGALSASYPFVLYSDLTDLHDFVRGNCTAGFSGLLWAPEVRGETNGKESFIKRLQTNVFSAQCLINAWCCPEIPWYRMDCKKETAYWLGIREQLKPMLVEAFRKYRDEGIAPVRGVVSDYTNDPKTYELDDEYLFCENLLVCPVFVDERGRKVYLPEESRWRNYFTKEPVESGEFYVETEDILVYERY